MSEKPTYQELEQRIRTLEEEASAQAGRLEAALRESEENYRQLFENSPAGIYRVDFKNGRFVKANDVFCRYLGYSLDELTSLSPYDILTEESRKLFLERLGKMARGETVSEIVEYEIIDRKGKRWCVLLHNRNICDAEGRVVASDVVAHDITERKRTEDALRASEERFKSIVTTSQEWVWAIDTRGIHTYSNSAVERILGYRPEEIIGAPVLDSMIHAQDLPKVMALLKQCLEQKEGWPHTVFRWKHRDGTYRYLESCATPIIDSAGVLQGFQGSDRDITARQQAEDAIRQSEERYRTIFESTATANMILAQDTTILMVNNDFTELSGYAKEELEGKTSWTAFVHPDDLERLRGYHWMRRIDPESVPSSYEFRFLNRKGEVRHLFLSTAMIPQTSESIVSLVDLTEKRRLETQLVQAQKMESVGRLAGGVAHDFNNMLSVIIGNTEMALLRVGPTEPLHKALQDILNAGNRSAELTRQLLAFARKQTISPAVLDLNETVAGMLKMLQRLIGEHINLVWMPGPKLWRVRIDPSQVDQILANLTVNARDAVNGAGRITIETSNALCDEAFCASQPDGAPGDYVSLAVSDNGCGMAKETLDNIFEPFFTTKQEGQGTGLGLATVYGIVKQNGGFITVGSEPGQGTTLRIYLPRCTAEGLEAAEDPERTHILRGTETILIVEDEEAVLHLGKSILEMLGYKVLAARGTGQALRMAREHAGNIDLLVTDVVMPGMNGKVLSEQIAALKPGLKCLFMSGYTADVIARQGILEKGIQFISKPFSIKDLAGKVRETLGQGHSPR